MTANSAARDLFAAFPTSLKQSALQSKDHELRDFLAARRCVVCGAPHAGFGFGVFVRRGQFGRWFCGAHRADGEAMMKTGSA